MSFSSLRQQILQESEYIEDEFNAYLEMQANIQIETYRSNPVYQPEAEAEEDRQIRRRSNKLIMRNS